MTSVGAVDRFGGPPDGLRRFDPSRDLGEVIALLRSGFGADLDERDRRWLEELDQLSATGPMVGWLLKLVPAAENVFSGFIWTEDGRVVANASLMRATPRVWTVANVVTLPEYRRRGIARALVVAAIDAARAHGAREVQLQVRDDNLGAKALYRQLGFQRLFGVTTFRLESAAGARREALAGDGVSVVPWGGESRWA